MEKVRCPWCAGDSLYEAYHDLEWGQPCRDGARLFELLLLEAAQAGLSWISILRRRKGYRVVWDGFDPERLARLADADLARLATDSRIVRNRRKIEAFRTNARAWLNLAQRADPVVWLWETVDGTPVVNHPVTTADVPAETEASRALSRRLRAAGFVFVGPVICYAFMQSAGLVCDHLTSCFCHPDNR